MSETARAIGLPGERGPLEAAVHVPGSKSITNRALICAALAEGSSILRNASDSEDTARMANALNQLGVLVRRSGDDLHVEGTGGRLSAPKLPIPVGNAGTTFRFLLTLAAAARGTTTFELSPRMAERPLDDLIAALGRLGVTVARDPSGLFVQVTGGRIEGGTVEIRADRSSQFLSSLLLSAPCARGPVRIVQEGQLASAPYVAMTLEVMRAFGVEVDRASGFLLPPESRYRPGDFRIETDASGASYPMAAAAIAGGTVSVPGLVEHSVQGDMGFVRILRETGCTVGFSPGGLWVRGDGKPRGVEVDMNAMPDVVPTLLAVALFASEPTRIRNVGHLRFKESNRLETLAGELRKLGADVEVGETGLAVRPAPLHGARLSPHDDHRLAMAFALIGLRIGGIFVENPECVRKSFPGFWTEYARMTAGTTSDAEPL